MISEVVKAIILWSRDHTNGKDHSLIFKFVLWPILIAWRVFQIQISLKVIQHRNRMILLYQMVMRCVYFVLPINQDLYLELSIWCKTVIDNSCYFSSLEHLFISVIFLGLNDDIFVLVLLVALPHQSPSLFLPFLILLSQRLHEIPFKPFSIKPRQNIL